MDSRQNELNVPFLRSCEKETTPAVSGTVTGKIPEWLQGNLVRVGSGLLKVGPDPYHHLFDGLALMHKFSIEKGQVSYQSRFLRSDSYRKNMKANRIVCSEFGTKAAAPDPCKTIFERFSSLFSFSELTDNDLVNIVKYTDEFYACSETNFIWKIDPDTLESLEKVNLGKYVPIVQATAHAHEGTDGTVYNVGNTMGRSPSYNIFKFPPKADAKSGAFDGGSIVASIPMSRRFSPSYYHSFGMTENYFIFVEQPLTLSVPRLMLQAFLSGSFCDYIYWQPEYECRFHVVRRKDGELLQTRYVSEAFMLFHHINAYEENNHLVVDMCCYDNGEIVKALYVKALHEIAADPSKGEAFQSRPRRYVLPLNVGEEQEKNLVELDGSTCKAVLRKDGSIFCEPEFLCEPDWYPELPRIHYERFNGRKYRYFYAMAKFMTTDVTKLIKVDTENKKALEWKQDGTIPSEPVFVANPNAPDGDEDDGVLLFSLLFTNDDRKVAFVVLNAKTMQELGRSEFQVESSVPGDFHGVFIQKST